MSPIELLGVVVSALAIALTAKRKMLCWPVGLVSVALYGWIFFDAKLYSDMLLQVAFAGMQMYGWWHWIARGKADGGKHDPIVQVQPLRRTDLLKGLVAGAVASVVLGGIMATSTDAALPWVDATLSAFSLVAQYWTARKHIASWILWTVLDCIYVGMFVFKALYPTAVLYAFFVVLAVLGWRSWQKTLNAQRANAIDGTLPAGGGHGEHDAQIGSGRDIGAWGAFASVVSTPSVLPGGAAAAATSANTALEQNDPDDVRQFGVYGEQAERDWPLMIVSEVADVLSSYRIKGTIDRLSWHSPRPFAAAALATMSTGETLFVKRHHKSLRDVQALAEEHRFIAHLAAQGIPVAQVIADRLGRSAIAIGDWTYEVYLSAPGEDIYRNVMSWEPFKRTDHAFAAGAALAQLHVAAKGYAAPARPPRLLLSSFQVIGAMDLLAAAQTWIDAQPLLSKALAHRPWREDLATVIGPWHAQLQPYLASLPALWTHGDWHASNLLWGAHHEVRSVLDFGLADQTCALYDLALAIERNTIGWLEPEPRRAVHLDQVDALLEGYTSRVPLNAQDYAALVALLPIVHTEFALSEVGYFASVLDLSDDADAAYDGYLLGHARWFSQPAGQALLAHLRGRGTLV